MMTSVSTSRRTARPSVMLQINCAEVPPALRNGMETRFGMQDKARKLHAPVARTESSAQFEFPLEIRRTEFDIDFAGSFVLGTPGARFVYLGWRRELSPDEDWIRRWKISLVGITRELLDATGPDDKLVGEVAATDLVWIGTDKWTIERATAAPIADPREEI